MKIKIGIIFGGFSKEREISFAGGRTVYDNLNKSLFEAVPIFVDSFGNFVLLNWEFVYKGSIRDFYPPAEFIPNKEGDFQIYAEQIGKLSSPKVPCKHKNAKSKCDFNSFASSFFPILLISSSCSTEDNFPICLA